MDNGDLAIFFMLTTGALAATSLVFAVLWIRSRERVLKARIESAQPASAVQTQMEHLMNAVDTMAVEVERISEAQRFTAQVLSERLPSAPPVKRVPDRVITPH